MNRPLEPASAQSVVYQFRITLLDVTPSVWRRIQVPGGTVDQLHEHIQTAMGWTNSHLHDFSIAGQRYGDPALLDEGGGQRDFHDSTEIRLSQLFAKLPRAFAFFYEYDFGDCWRHAIIYEGTSPAEAGVRYPRCVDGARACPPDDCGGPPGYEDFLQAIRDPSHEDHEEMIEWIGGDFNPDAFSTASATKAMRRGLPNWRNDCLS